MQGLDECTVPALCLRRSLHRRHERPRRCDHVRSVRRASPSTCPAGSSARSGSCTAPPTRITGGRLGLRPFTETQWGMLRLTTVGRRSGKERVAIVGYIVDGPNLVVPAMNGWADPEPAWWLNLQANPDTQRRAARGPARGDRPCRGRGGARPTVGAVRRPGQLGVHGRQRRPSVTGNGARRVGAADEPRVRRRLMTK